MAGPPRCRAGDDSPSVQSHGSDLERAAPPLGTAGGSHSDSDGSGGGAAREEARPPAFLLIRVHEARSLVPKDSDTNSSDPYVKITLAGCVRKTRAIYRSTHPMWEQSVALPLAGIPDDQPLTVELFDRDFRGKEFLGQVVMTLGKARHIAQHAALGESYWFALGKRSSSDVVGGTLCLGFKLLDAEAYEQLLPLLETQLSGDHVSAHLSGKALWVQLRGLRGLGAAGLLSSDTGSERGASLSSSVSTPSVGPAASMAGDEHSGAAALQPEVGQTSSGLSLYIKLGRVMLEKPLPAHAHNDKQSHGRAGAAVVPAWEMHVDEEVTIPLAAALRRRPRSTRRQDELLDIKVYLARSKQPYATIAKTQVPVLDVPCVTVTPSHVALASRAASLHAGQLADACVAQPGGGQADAAPPLRPAAASSTPPRSPFSCPQVSAELHPAAETPRGRFGSTTDFLLASYRGATSALASPRTARAPRPLSPGPLASPPPLVGDALEPAMSSGAVSVKVALVSALSERCRSPGHQACGDGPGSDAAGSYVEGSLCSVTAAMQDPAPQGLPGRRRCHGLAELHDNMRSALRGVLVPAREVSRLGWQRIKGAGDADSGTPQGLKEYVRTMESFWPLPARLEVALAMGLVPVPPIIAGAAKSAEVMRGSGQANSREEEEEGADEEEEGAETADEEGGGFGLDDEDGPDAAPMQLPPPHELPLIDALLPLGLGALHALLFSRRSPLMAAHWQAEGITDVSAGPWRRSSADGCLRTRTLAYTKRLSIPVPLAPKQCKVWEEQRLLARSSGGFVMELVCTNNAPKGDCFRAIVQLCVARRGRGACRLVVSMVLQWHKQTLGKSLVATGASVDAQRSWGRLLAALQAQAASLGGALRTSQTVDGTAADVTSTPALHQSEPTSTDHGHGGAIADCGRRTASVGRVIVRALHTAAVQLDGSALTCLLLALQLVATVVLCYIACGVARDLSTLAALLRAEQTQ